MYAFTFGRNEKAVMVFRFDDPDKALELLRLTTSTCSEPLTCSPAAL